MEEKFEPIGAAWGRGYSGSRRPRQVRLLIPFVLRLIGTLSFIYFHGLGRVCVFLASAFPCVTSLETLL